MSTCISTHGEYGQHIIDENYVCTRCAVLDEDALIEAWTKVREAWDTFRPALQWLYDECQRVLDTIGPFCEECGSSHGNHREWCPVGSCAAFIANTRAQLRTLLATPLAVPDQDAVNTARWG